MSRTVGRAIVPPIHLPFDPDDIDEFHAARLLILIEVCGEGSLSGRTKLVKLDFFMRYPAFLERALQQLHISTSGDSIQVSEAPMIRYRYGPWDPRYRQFLIFLECRGLVSVSGKKLERVALTAAGRRAVAALDSSGPLRPLFDRARSMVGNLAEYSGSELKNFVYDLLQEEVTARPLGEVIRP